MAVTTARRVEGYSEISEQVLAENSIIRKISRNDVEGEPGATQCKVYVNELSEVANYVPGTGVAVSQDNSNYVDLNNLKEKAVNEILDGYTVETAPADYVVSRYSAAVAAFGEKADTDGFEKMVADGTSLVSAGGPVVATSNVYEKIKNLKIALDKAKAPHSDRSLIVTPEVEGAMLDKTSGVILDTSRGDEIQTEGYIGRFLGFDVYETALVPSGTNMIAMQKRGFAFKDNWKRDVRLQSLDGSGKYIGDSAIQGRWAYNCGAVRPTLIQLDKGAAPIGG